jgi:hypothetical protein
MLEAAYSAVKQILLQVTRKILPLPLIGQAPRHEDAWGERRYSSTILELGTS